MANETTEKLFRSGYGGTDTLGFIVDRREVPTAAPIQADEKNNIPEPKPIDIVITLKGNDRLTIHQEGTCTFTGVQSEGLKGILETFSPNEPQWVQYMKVRMLLGPVSKRVFHTEVIFTTQGIHFWTYKGETFVTDTPFVEHFTGLDPLTPKPSTISFTEYKELTQKGIYILSGMVAKPKKETDEAKPCPFCGLPVFFGRCTKGYTATCYPCDISMVNEDKNILLGNWNRRSAGMPEPKFPEDVVIKNQSG